MTVGEHRNERRRELIAVLKDVLTILDDERVLDAPEELDAVAASLAFIQPIADRLAQKPRPMTPRYPFGRPVHVLEGLRHAPDHINERGTFQMLGD
jgi:hypothetical protein